MKKLTRRESKKNLLKNQLRIGNEKTIIFFLLFSFFFSQKLDTIVSDREISLNESIDFTIKLNNIDTNPEVNFIQY
ncbi:MAG: hypothetical protein Ct9H90mP15_06590 [Candidatus Neomarinimicrobiota bacterium]|nr:MAG: hypothetical protein Ct9H90mP15_06590 [Candidatus Neomarinimicrobiota bacterium]